MTVEHLDDPTAFLDDEGCPFCFLYTDLANPASNAIYEATVLGVRASAGAGVAGGAIDAARDTA